MKTAMKTAALVLTAAAALVAVLYAASLVEAEDTEMVRVALTGR